VTIIKRAKKQTKKKYEGAVVVTQIALLDNVSHNALEELVDIANRCGQLRSDIWNKYGSVSGWGLNRNIHDKHQLQISLRTIFPLEKYGLTAKLYERTAYKCLDEIATYHDAVKSYVVDEIYRRYDDETERAYLVMMLNTQAWSYVNSCRARWLHRTIRKYFYRGHTRKRNQIVYNGDMYKIVPVGKKSYIELSTLSKGKRLRVQLHGSPEIESEIKVLIRSDHRIEIHYPGKRFITLPENRVPQAGVDRGYTEVFVDSQGQVYGDGLGKIITQATNQQTDLSKKRGKLHALARKLEAQGKHEKAQNIRRNNLGKAKLTRKKRKLDGKLKTLVFTATVELFKRYEKVFYEDLTEPIKDKRGLKGKAAARMSRWYKGIVADAISQVSVRLNAQAIQVNPAYTSQTDSRYGVLLGTRNGDSFHCFDGVVLQADYNAARNIFTRGYDAEIPQYMKFTQVKSILLRRTELFQEQQLRDRAKTLEGYKGEQLSLFDITLSHSESAV
jgi:transposase